MTNGKLGKIKEWLKEHKLYFIQAGCAIAIVVIVAAIMIPDMAVTHGRLEAAMNRVDQGIAHIGSEIADQARVVQSISADLEAAEDEVDELADTVGSYYDTIVAAAAKADELASALDQLQGQIGAIDASAPEAWLTGVAGNFTLHVKVSDAGLYSATIYLCYAEPVVLGAGNHTAAVDEFYAIVDWGEAGFAYIPTLSHDGHNWVVTAVSFNIGTVHLEVAEETIVVVYGGLPEDYKPDWAYAAVWPAWKDEPAS